MQNNKKLWILVFVVIIVTIGASLVSFQTQGQKIYPIQNKTPEEIQDKYASKFPVTNYDELEPANLEEREKRNEKSKRYNNKRLVSKNPHPEDAGVTVFDETPLPPPIPTTESEAIVIGEVLKAEAHLSNDKRSVYSEFTIRVDKVLKNDSSNKVNQGNTITVDRIGGYVRYPNGQKVLYRIAGKEPLEIAKHYGLFLTNTDKSLNYYVLTGYELKENKFYPLDLGFPFEIFKGMDEEDFIATINQAIAQPSKKINN